MRTTEAVGNEKITGGDGIAWKRLPLAVLLAAVAAAVANALIYFAASALGLIPQSALIPTAVGESPLTVGMVVIVSVIGAVGAAIVFAVIGLFARRPVRLFRVVAVVVLVLSFATPLTIPGAPLSMILSMEVMHVVAWAVIVGLLTTVARR
ncbi:MAG TPA: DUF6069 family protein [Rubrobacteraceae bacterium]|nr:DUF6069 family protein [Rubrobacteraceae bacterium]